jgi:hypothetical protein
MVVSGWLLTLAAAPLAAQTPTGGVSGHVTDTNGSVIAGATVTARSTNLQGTATTQTSVNGDYLFTLLPPGDYTLVFTLAGFTPLEQHVHLGATERTTLGVTLKAAAVSESVTVTAPADTFVNTVQAASNVRHEEIRTLPVSRNLPSYINLSPAVHNTGPDGNPTISGAMSFENSFQLNGVQIQDNLRGTSLPLYIEDAVQEVTVATSGISAEYGRFSGGTVNALTKSGSNTFHGSVRETFNNDNWRTVSPFGEPKHAETVPTFEGTLGGYILKDRLWFFGAGRAVDTTLAQETGITRVPYTAGTNQKREEGNATLSLGTGRRLRVDYTNISEHDTNSAYPSASSVMDLASLTNRDLPENLLSVHYTQTIGSRWYVEGQYSARNLSFQHDGGLFTDIVRGTPLCAPISDCFSGFGQWWSAPNFCGVCQDEQRDNDSLLLKGTYFLSTGKGSHDIVFGYDTFNDRTTSDNHQSASDFHLWAADYLVDGSTIYPVITGDGNTVIVHWPINQTSQGTNFRTHSLFAQDNWMVNRHLTVNLGVRFDKNSGRNSIDALVANDSAVSPRLGLVWDPVGNGRTSVNVSYARYVSALANNIAGETSPGGTPSIFAYFYEGPDINTGDGPLVSTADALQQVFDWYNSAHPDPFVVNVPGVDSKIVTSLESPHADEAAIGLSRVIGTRGAVRVDVVHRKYADFYSERIDQSTGQVEDELGQVFDLRLVENTNLETRNYSALNVQGSYHVSDRLDLGLSYTLSHLSGTIDGETSAAGPIPTTVASYPEYFEPSWSNPEGDLAADQRHRARIWGTVELLGKAHDSVSIGVLSQIESGTPYGAIGAISTIPYVDNPGYVTPPEPVSYFFTARDAFHTDLMARTDLAFNYAHRFGAAELFVNAHVLNVFNQFQAFNGNDINTTVLTAFDDPDRFASFDPFTETPVQGVNWDYGSKFGQPVGAGAYTLPRTFRLSAGFRF